MSRRFSWIPSLNIRFFTPATKSLFNIIPSDVGRPLADLNSLAADGALLSDARTVLQTLAPVEREIEAQTRRLVYPPHICPTAPRTTESKASSSLLPISPSARHAADALEAAEAAGGAGQCREVALSRRREPRSAPAAANARADSGAVGKNTSKANAQRRTGRTARRDVGRHVGHAEHAARHQPDRGRHRPRRNRRIFPISTSAGAGCGTNSTIMRRRRSLPCMWSHCSLFDRQRSAPAGADAPQSAFERIEIHQARQGAARLPPPRRNAEHRGLGHRQPASRRANSRRSSTSIISSTMPRANGSAVLGLACPSCRPWANCSATGCRSARSRARARSFPSRSCSSRATSNRKASAVGGIAGPLQGRPHRRDLGRRG